MKTLYFECQMGAAGDMMMAALLELHPNPDEFLRKLNALGVPGVEISRKAVLRSGIKGTSITVRIHGAEEETDHDHHDHGHDHTHHSHDHDHTHHSHDHSHSVSFGMMEVADLLNRLSLPDAVKANALAVYQCIGEAEAAVHGVPVQQIHFHEVGQMDAIADIVGVCWLMEELQPTRIVASPVKVGSGQVKTAHGILPVPAPATAVLLQGVPCYAGEFQGELCTPTGAALLKHFAEAFSPMPVMTVSAIGYGMGKKEFPAVNCLRAFLGEEIALNTDETVAVSGHTAITPNDEVVELNCNLDDMTPEAIGFVTELLLSEGALDAFIIPIQMKKNRPAHLLVCLCEPGQEGDFSRFILSHTTTRGVRQATCSRYVLSAETLEIDTPYGLLRVKKSAGYGITKMKPEYADVARYAKEHHVPFDEVYRAALFAIEKIR